MPTYTALHKHALRANYVLKLLFSISSTSCDVLNNCFQLGWESGENNEIVAIDWEELDVVESFISMCVTCGCKTGCNTGRYTGRCKCFHKGTKCNVKCKCKGCTNKVTTRDVGSSSSFNSDSLAVDGDEGSTDDSESENEELDIQMFVDNCLDNAPIYV